MGEIYEDIYWSIIGSCGMAFFLSIIIGVNINEEMSIGRIIVGIVLLFVIIGIIVFFVLRIIAKIRMIQYIRNKQYEIIARHVIKGIDGYCIYFDDNGEKTTVKISRMTKLPLEYIGKVAEEIILQTPPSFFIQRHYLKVEIKKGRYSYFHITEKVDGFATPEPLPVELHRVGW